MTNGTRTPGSAEPPVKGRFGFQLLLIRLVLVTWVCAALLVIGAGFVAFVVYDQAIQPATPGPAASFSVPEGATGRDVGRLLVEKGFLEHEFFFRIALMYDGTGKAIRHGTYDLPRGMSALQILHVLHEGPARPLNVDRFRVTIPEGLSLQQMAALFEEPDKFVEAAKNPGLVAELGLDVPTLEGFLMPDTYFFDRQPTESELVERMFRQFRSEYDRLARNAPGVDMKKVVTVASLVEEEAKVDQERPLIAAVIYNRLDSDMPLQLDATLQYALNKYGQRLLDEDKQVDSPYNCYRNKGLPPGPISCPGAASLRAALQPSNVEYLYFVSNADGRTHTFSRTLEEHNSAVARFRREIAVQRREEAAAEGTQ